MLGDSPGEPSCPKHHDADGVAENHEATISREAGPQRRKGILAATFSHRIVGELVKLKLRISLLFMSPRNTKVLVKMENLLGHFPALCCDSKVLHQWFTNCGTGNPRECSLSQNYVLNKTEMIFVFFSLLPGGFSRGSVMGGNTTD